MVVDYKLAKRETWRREGGAHDRNAKRLHAMCGANGGLYVKAGQFASTAGGVPEAYARRLSKLQDEVAPSPRDAVLKVVRNEFGGRAPEALFETFEPEPMAAASLAQVHRAVLKSGRTVAVKIQRPGLERSIESDISTMSALVRFTRLFFPSFDFGFMVDEFKSRLEKEIDFEAEGRNCERLGLAFADDARIDDPRGFLGFNHSSRADDGVHRRRETDEHRRDARERSRPRARRARTERLFRAHASRARVHPRRSSPWKFALPRAPRRRGANASRAVGSRLVQRAHGGIAQGDVEFMDRYRGRRQRPRGGRRESFASAG